MNKVSQKIPQQRVWGEYMKARARISTPQQRVWGGLGEHQKQDRKSPQQRVWGGMIRKASKDPPE